VPDELLRPFRDKIRGRTPAARPAGEPEDPAGEQVPPDSILIRDVQIGPFPEASHLHSGFAPGIPRIRLTLDVGAGLRKQAEPLGAEETEALLRLCPRLLDHDCGAAGHLRGLLAGPGPDGGTAAPAVVCEEGDGLQLAHLIEHVAIEIIVAATGVLRCSGATCAHADRLDRFDLFLECADPLTGRAAAVLAAALVRDLRLRLTVRLALHRRCLDLLVLLSPAADARLVAEDVSVRLGCGTDEALQALEELVRLGYLDAGPAPYLFSSSTGVLFRRAAIHSSPG
jgi:hypothetical protein